ncbi:hypothetical protein EYF80_001708 [Liparis tanakae]|uniref:Uncharacterized protein n=1 Tax=Liparis tanakae TaxID=230148 RepID=A0A4Z2JDS1_9TELE|nr:hypothetical protein EYF80_001708 [Liparis tanakae]
MSDLDPPPAGQVPVEVELLLQLQGLVPGGYIRYCLSGGKVRGPGSGGQQLSANSRLWSNRLQCSACVSGPGPYPEAGEAASALRVKKDGPSEGAEGGMFPGRNKGLLQMTSLSFGAPSLLNFFIFILRFWNQILTCLSVRFNSLATSYLRSLVR